jgi:prepilin-type N-terminal cleavage/methylation domain-containing protein
VGTAVDGGEVPGQQAGARRKSRRGLSLLETMIALAVLSVGLGAIAVASARCSQMQNGTVDYIRAHNLCRNVIERLQDGSLVTRFQQYKAAPIFTSRNLRVQVRFPTQAAIDSLGIAIPNTARFRDLDGDGELDLDAASTDIAGLLPVWIEVSRPGFRFRSEVLLVGS